MLKRIVVLLICILSFSLSSLWTSTSFSYEKGIYITSGTAQSPKKIDYLIRRAKTVGITTFVVDVYGRNKTYANSIAKIKAAGIRYVARLVMFPYGAKGAQIKNQQIWANRWQRAQYAVSLGANAIQLDYIRYHRGTSPSAENERNVYQVIKFFRNKLRGTGVQLQIDIFGVAAHRPTRTIGQNAVLFAQSLDAINPMVYPSHYEPFRHHAVRPYSTVLNSVQALKKQLAGNPHVKVYAYLELFNYRYPMSYPTKVKYIQAQIQGAMNGGADGWYAWSANNHYNILFNLLGGKKRGSNARE